MQVTTKEMTAAFTLWDKLYRKNPEQYMNETTRLLKYTPKSNGEANTIYFVELLKANRIANVMVKDLNPKTKGKKI